MPGLPVYSVRDSNDIYLRAYHNNNCPKFEANLNKLYESEPWKSTEANSQGILTKLATLFPDDVSSGNSTNAQIQNGAVVMKYLWNYYDQIQVARTECNPDPTVYACTSLGASIYKLNDALTDTEFQELSQLVATTESMK